MDPATADLAHSHGRIALDPDLQYLGHGTTLPFSGLPVKQYLAKPSTPTLENAQRADDYLDARGEILAAFNYAPGDEMLVRVAHAVAVAEHSAAMFVVTGDELTRLRDVVELQGRVIEELAAQMKQLMDERESTRRGRGATDSAATT